MLSKCLGQVTTKYRELFIVDEKKSLQESETYCESLSAKLPSLNSTSMISDIWSYLTACNIGDNENPIANPRDEMWWRIGLTSENGNWKWSDIDL